MLSILTFIFSVSFSFIFIIFLLGILHPKIALPFWRATRKKVILVYAPLIFCNFLTLFFFTALSVTPQDRDTVYNNYQESIKKTQIEIKPKETFSLNSPFKLGEFVYNIQKISQKKKVGNSTFNETAQEGAVFIVIEYTIKNESNETKTVMTDDFKLIDSNGRTFDASSKAATVLQLSTSSDFWLSEIQPGLKQNFITCFEIPEESFNQQGLVLIIPEKGLWNTGKATIALN